MINEDYNSEKFKAEKDAQFLQNDNFKIDNNDKDQKEPVKYLRSPSTISKLSNLLFDNAEKRGSVLEPFQSIRTLSTLSKLSSILYENDGGRTRIKYRYIITLLEFLAYCQINCFRLNTSISMNAMVNSTAINAHNFDYNTSESCPLNDYEVANSRAPQREGEFNWDPQVQGVILGASFLGYVMTQIPGGLLAEKCGAKSILIAGIFISSLCHLLCPYASWASSKAMIAAQFLRGMAQGLIPAAHCVLAANWYPSNERGFLNSLVLSGYSVGALMGGFPTGVLCTSALFGGWPGVYYVFGGLGILLAFSMHLYLYESPKAYPDISQTELKFILQNQEMNFAKKRPPTPWGKMFTSVPVYALMFAVFAQFWTETHLLTVHAAFLGTILHYNIEENGIYVSLAFVLQTLLTITASYITKWLQKKELLGVDKLRKGNNFMCFFGYSAFILAVIYSGCDASMSNIYSMIGMGFIGLSFGGCMIVAVDMSPNFAGSMMGVAMTAGSTAGFILPVVVGMMTNGQQTLEQWHNFFYLSIGISMVSAILFCWFGSAEVQPWNFPSIDDFEKGNTTMNNKVKASESEEIQNDTVLHL